MSSNTEICNLALSHLGVGKEIANLETEKSQEASACRRFYEITRDQVLRDFAWPFATKVVSLALIEEDPNEEWAFSYRYPVDCLDVRKILSGTRNETQDTKVPYRISNDDTALCIYTDLEDAQIEYTAKVTNVDFFPVDFLQALSLRLAAYIAPRVTAGDPFKMGDRALQLYRQEMSIARANAVNEQQDERIVDSEFILARE